MLRRVSNKFLIALLIRFYNHKHGFEAVSSQEFALWNEQNVFYCLDVQWHDAIPDSRCCLNRAKRNYAMLIPRFLNSAIVSFSERCFVFNPSSSSSANLLSRYSSLLNTCTFPLKNFFNIRFKAEMLSDSFISIMK